MKHTSFRTKLLASFLAVGVVPLVICVLLMLNIFQASLTRQAADTARGELAGVIQTLDVFFSRGETAMGRLQGDAQVIQTLNQSRPAATQALYSSLYGAAGTLVQSADLSLYDDRGRWVCSTATGREDLPTHWGILAAADETNSVLYRGVDSGVRAAAAIRNQGVTVGYAVVDVSSAQLRRIFVGEYSAANGLLLLDPFWDKIYASSEIQDEALPAHLRTQLLSAQTLGDQEDRSDFYIGTEPHSGFVLVLRQPKPLAEWMMRLLYLVSALSILLCLGLGIAVSMGFSRQLFHPIQTMNAAMRQVEEGNLSVRLDNSRTDEMGQLAGRFNRMTERLETNLADSLRQQQELSDAQIRMMQAQLNPHFLYNTLDTIKWMGKIHKAPEVATIAADLADILRGSISAGEFVPLRNELRLVERYVEIQSIRFSGTFALHTDVDETLLDVPVPKLMLQPVVENAIVHGFEGRDGGEIFIVAHRVEQQLVVDVRDNGCGVSQELLEEYRADAVRGSGGHLGLHNVDAILRIRYGPGQGVRFVPVPQGTCVRITLPVCEEGGTKLC